MHKVSNAFRTDLIHNGNHRGEELKGEHQSEASEASLGRTFGTCDT